MSKVLVVGGAGYVGGYLVDAAVAAGHVVRVFDKLVYEDAYLKDIDFVYGDVNNMESLRPHLDWAETVIWLAAVVGDPACALNPEFTMETNVGSVKNLVANFSGRIIFPSTCSVYGAQDGLLDESSPFDPLSLYAESKIEAEKVLLAAPNETLNVLTIRAVREKQMSVFGGQQFRPLLHVRDVATAVVPHIDTHSTGVYNLHTENLTIIALAEKIQEHVPGAVLKITESSFQDARNYAVSSEKARTELGFDPKWSVDDGIVEIFQAISQNRIPDVSLPRFSNVAALQGLLGAK
jgi:nucleoside-diphosphate-sugar epimerase